MQQLTPSSGRRQGPNSVLINAAALLGAFLLAPRLYALSTGWVLDYTARNYGGGLDGLIGILWALGCPHLPSASSNSRSARGCASA